jgi:hypothetical protein
MSNRETLSRIAAETFASLHELGRKRAELSRIAAECIESGSPGVEEVAAFDESLARIISAGERAACRLLLQTRSGHTAPMRGLE